MGGAGGSEAPRRRAGEELAGSEPAAEGPGRRLAMMGLISPLQGFLNARPHRSGLRTITETWPSLLGISIASARRRGRASGPQGEIRDNRRPGGMAEQMVFEELQRQPPGAGAACSHSPADRRI